MSGVAHKLCESVEDILSEFEYLFPPSNRPPSSGETGVLPALELGPNEQKVYDALDHEEVSIDDVIRKSGLPRSAVSVALLSLEMKRLIRQPPEKIHLAAGSGASPAEPKRRQPFMALPGHCAGR
jgi:DNA processing protein